MEDEKKEENKPEEQPEQSEQEQQDPSQPEVLNKYVLRSLNMNSATEGDRYLKRPYIVYLNPQVVEGAKLSPKQQAVILLVFVILVALGFGIFKILEASGFIS